MKNIAAFCLIAALSTLTSCRTQATAHYLPPEPLFGQADHQRVIHKNYDDTWDALIQFATESFFGIEKFEKHSGLITLSFGAERPSEFVDGGHWKMQHTNDYGRTINFDGNYVDFLTEFQSGRLDGQMSVIVNEQSATETLVTVKTRYVFTASAFDPDTTVSFKNTWTFSSGESSTITVTKATEGTPPKRTLRPTDKAEMAILAALDAIE